MAELYEIDTIKKLLAKHGCSFDKRLGQNFIAVPDVCPRIADSLGDVSHTGVLEVGPGIGVLTRELSKRAAVVTAVEVDGSLLPILAETLRDCGNVNVINADIMKSDLGAVLDHFFDDMDVYVAANIPYSITSPLIVKLLESASGYSPYNKKKRMISMTLMVQKEAGERLISPVGSRSAGAISAAVQYYAEGEKLFDVPRKSFIPEPKVDSEVIKLTMRDEPPIAPADSTFFWRLVRAVFTQRRKTAVNSLSAGLSLPKETVACALQKMGRAPTDRAETFSMEELCGLSDLLCAKSAR